MCSTNISLVTYIPSIFFVYIVTVKVERIYDSTDNIDQLFSFKNTILYGRTAIVENEQVDKVSFDWNIEYSQYDKGNSLKQDGNDTFRTNIILQVLQISVCLFLQ